MPVADSVLAKPIDWRDTGLDLIIGKCAHPHATWRPNFGNAEGEIAFGVQSFVTIKGGEFFLRRPGDSPKDWARRVSRHLSVAGKGRLKRGRCTEPPIQTEPLNVSVIDGEILIWGFATTSPSLNAKAARETAQLLVNAADALERRVV